MTLVEVDRQSGEHHAGLKRIDVGFIILGSILGVAVIFVIILCCCLCRRKRRVAPVPALVYHPYPGEYPAHHHQPQPARGGYGNGNRTQPYAAEAAPARRQRR